MELEPGTPLDRFSAKNAADIADFQLQGASESKLQTFDVQIVFSRCFCPWNLFSGNLQKPPEKLPPRLFSRGYSAHCASETDGLPLSHDLEINADLIAEHCFGPSYRPRGACNPSD